MSMVDADIRSTLIAQEEILFQLATMLFTDDESRPAMVEHVRARINLGVGLNPSDPRIADLDGNERQSVMRAAQKNVEDFWGEVRRGWPDLGGEPWVAG